MHDRVESTWDFNKKEQVKQPELVEFYQLYRELLKYNGKSFKVNNDFVKLSCNTEEVRLFSWKKVTWECKTISIKIDNGVHKPSDKNNNTDIGVLKGFFMWWLVECFVSIFQEFGKKEKENTGCKIDISVTERFPKDNSWKKHINVQLVFEKNGITEIQGISLEDLKRLLEALNKNFLKKLRREYRISKEDIDNHERMVNNDQKEADELLEQIA